MNFFTNPWVVGIGSGFLIWLITTAFFLRRERKAFKQKIETANNEIIFAIRLSMNAGEFPPLSIINALIISTALKYTIKRKHLYNFSILADLFIKEIMDNALISASQKSELCKLIEKEKESFKMPIIEEKKIIKKAKLQFMIPIKEPLLLDNFDDYFGWYNYGKGMVLQSNDVAYIGNFSLKKDGNSDPNGGFKKLKEKTGLGIVFSGWIYRPSKSVGGLGDRLAIEDSNFNGYGFCVAHNNNLVWIERRDEGKYTIISEKYYYIAPKDKWYHFEFRMGKNGKFNVNIFDSLGGSALDLSCSDSIYDTFDQIAVHGGFVYYVDKLKIERISE